MSKITMRKAYDHIRFDPEITKASLMGLIEGVGITRESGVPGAWQDIEQFADFLLLLNKLPRIRTICEVGSYTGHTLAFVTAVCERKGELQGVFSVDIKPQITQDVKEALGKALYVIPSDSASVKEWAYDLVIIDADHTYQAAKQDWENVGQYAKRACAFHDIDDDPLIVQYFGTPNVHHLWDEIKRGKDYREILSHASMGWGVLLTPTTK